MIVAEWCWNAEIPDAMAKLLEGWRNVAGSREGPFPRTQPFSMGFIPRISAVHDEKCCQD